MPQMQMPQMQGYQMPQMQGYQMPQTQIGQMPQMPQMQGYQMPQTQMGQMPQMSQIQQSFVQQFETQANSAGAMPSAGPYNFNNASFVQLPPPATAAAAETKVGIAEVAAAKVAGG